MGDVAIRTQGLSKRFGGVEALSSLDLRVERGEVLGFAHHENERFGPIGVAAGARGRGLGHVLMFRTLRAIGFRGHLSLELFNRDYWKEDPLTVARTGLEKMKAAARAGLA